MAKNSKGVESNPLNSFRSYSYQHMLLVSDSTEAIKKYQEVAGGASYAFPQFENSQIGQPLPGSQVGGSGGVYVVVDGRKTTQYTIKDLSYTSLLLGSGVNAVKSIVVNGSMHIYDPHGISFINYLQHIMDELLGTDISGLSWLLKTTFIGHNDDGTTTTVSTSSIPILINNIEVDFDHTGGNYAISFLGMADGMPSRHTSTSFVTHSATSFKSDKNQTLGSVIADFQRKINADLKKYYDELVINIPPASGQGGSTLTAKATAGTGRLVQCMFTIPSTWLNYKVEGSAAERFETIWKDKKKQFEEAKKTKKEPEAKGQAPVNEVFVNVEPTMTVDEVLAEILKHCDEAQKKLKIDPSSKQAVYAKTISTVTSDAHTMVLHWDIIEYVIPNINQTGPNNFPINPEWFDTGIDGIKRPKNSLEFDYLFSGKNTDVLNYEMKLKTAQLLLMDGFFINKEDRQLDRNKNNIPNNDPKKKENAIFIRPKSPIFYPAKTRDQVQGYAYMVKGSTQRVKNRQDHNEALASLISTNAIKGSLTIRGNPDLLQRSSNDIPPHVFPVDKGSAIAPYLQWVKKISQEQSGQFSKNLSAYPLLVKVNVYSPNNDMFNKTSDRYAGKFWYDKYYFATQIVNRFSGGEFTQEFVLNSAQLFEEAATTRKS